MRKGQGVRTGGLGHGGITCVLQTQFSSEKLITPDRFFFLLELQVKSEIIILIFE